MTDDGTWRYAWPAGARLLTELDALVPVVGRRVIDLGCGLGRLGRWAQTAGAAEVLFADGSAEALAALPPTCRTLLHRWGEPLPPCDVLLGGDILYRPACFAALVASIASALADRGTAWLADPRTRLDEELPGLAAAAGLSWRAERRAAGYTLVTASRRVEPLGRRHGAAGSAASLHACTHLN